MLKQLRLSNLILVERATLDFEGGLNVLSGETGSGKSAVLEGLSLIRGERASTDLVRQGCSHATVEALFDIDGVETLPILLEEAGIHHSSGEYLVIRREVHLNGKNRLFVNNQMAAVGLLQRIAHALFDFVGQHANQRLLEIDSHEEMLDLFGNLAPVRDAFHYSFKEEQALREEIVVLRNSEAERLRQTEVHRMEIEELEAAALKPNEDNALFAEYSMLANSEEIRQLSLTLEEALCGEGKGILNSLHRLAPSADRLAQLVPSLAEELGVLKTVSVELQEMDYSLKKCTRQGDSNPERQREISERLNLIGRLKRKYGSSLAEVECYLSSAREKLAALDSADGRIDELERTLAVVAQTTHEKASELTLARKQTAEPFSQLLTPLLRSLNMPEAEFEVRLTPKKRSSHGDDLVEFFFAPNPGEGFIPLKECASGGELSRVLLAIKALLADKEQRPILVFDEIDANIGGETASIVGETLASISQRHQVICVTHFPQVARCAHHHLRIAKHQVEGRTLTTITSLDEKEKEKELTRMLGGAKFSKTARKLATAKGER